ncbi:hypothetical protein F0562_015073 [Nyssa sinensis]|uniref:Uncharacterized protein n=1 Tax=Nyssa sinensis TaxID=561372 RepID=A0A5J4ZHN6_9ASTE|nr:hypothetical protein F0562_015073 [Nyssa sinensis]
MVERELTAHDWGDLISIDGLTDMDLVRKFYANLESHPIDVSALPMYRDFFIPTLERLDRKDHHIDHVDHVLDRLVVHHRELNRDVESMLSSTADDDDSIDDDGDVMVTDHADGRDLAK